MELGEPFAAGREADVYALDVSRVLRRYRTGTDVQREAEVMAYVGGLGYPVPEVFEAGGTDMVMERLDGPTLAQAAHSGELSIPDATAILADLLRRLHELPPRGNSRGGGGTSGGGTSGGGTSSGGGGGTSGGGNNSEGGSGEGGNSGSGNGETIVHLDLHPENVLLSRRGPVVIDWCNAGDGPGDLDTALSALILAQVATGAIEHPLNAGAGAMMELFLQLAPGDPLRLLDEAAAFRRRQLTMLPDEIAKVGTAVGRLRATGRTEGGAVRWFNLTLRFGLELCAFAALAYGGWHVPGAVWVRILAAVALPVVAAVVWGRWVAPKASHPIPDPLRLVPEWVVFGGATAALLATGHLVLAAMLAVLAAGNRWALHASRTGTDGEPA
ncbi:hypothetical protein GCM10010172_36820 [Paractinoplanes ferrugineus]|uniref:Aminoglycoside phosphotransferase domain-containing protein n=1 Tax=Paractinoplanes ferrugineus TaxID=113564 RepID=A0A919IYX2_9ACTN|nr:DUF2568 domain-containing protein [Actinoplanes ferrugineus]GIE09279.1 hypothetical protein Afe05nite_11190 [Actinoplanes ferrugineus]